MRTILSVFSLFLFYPFFATAFEMPVAPVAVAPVLASDPEPAQETFSGHGVEETFIVDPVKEKKTLFSAWWRRFTDVVSKEMTNEASAIRNFSKIKKAGDIDAFLETITDKEKNNVLLYSTLYSPFDFTQKVLPHVKNQAVVDQAFLIALSRTDYDAGLTVAAFFEADADPNTKDHASKITPLMLAAAFGDEAAAGTLLNNTKNINDTDDIGMTALSYAAHHASNPAIVTMLLQAGARTDIKDRLAMTPLQHLRQNAAMQKDKKYQDLLTQLGERKFIVDQPETEKFLKSLIDGKFEESLVFLKTGVDVNAKDSSGKTPLGHIVLSKNPVEAARFLLQKGAKINETDLNGDTALMHALKHAKNHDFVVFLIDSGANVNTPDARGLTPLAAAFVYAHKAKTAQYLIDAGAKTDVKDNNGKTPLDYAREKILTSGVKEYDNLIKSLENKTKTEKSSTVNNDFVLLLKNNDLNKISEYVSKNKGNVNKRNLNGDTFLFVALEHNASAQVMKELLTAGANVHLRRTNGQTPLTFAISNNVSPEVVLLLIQSGASKTDKDASGKSPLDLLNANKVYSQKDSDVIRNALNNMEQTDEDGSYTGDFLALLHSGSDAAIKKALATGADPDKQDANGNTPLLFLLQDPANPLALKRLLSAGANPNLANRNGIAPLSYAVTRKQPEEIIAILEKSVLTKEQEEKDKTSPKKYPVTDDSFIEDVYYLPPNVIELVLKNGLNPKKADGQTGKTPLMTAVTRLDNAVDATRLLLAEGVPLNDTDKNGDTALFYAVKANAPLVLVEGLIKNGADVNIFNKKGRTALTYALNNPNLFNLLVKNGADINARDKNGTPLLVNCLEDPDYFRLVKAGADINARDKDGNSILMNEILKPDYSPATIELLLQNGANVNLSNHDGETPLMKAAVLYKTSVGGKSDLMKSLIKAGADVNLYDNEGKTALIKAVSKTYNTPVILMLIDAGTNLSVRDNSFKTALDYAKENTSLRLEKDYPLILKKLAPDASVLNAKMFEALKQNDIEQMQSLLEQGASADATDDEGDTLLIKAVPLKNGDVLCDILIKAKAGLDKTNKDGDTALMKALIYKKNDLVLKLIQAGANVNVTNLKGETPLRRAFLYTRNVPLIQELIKAGANIQSKDAFGKTALNYVKDAAPVVKNDPEYGALLDSIEKSGKL